MKVLVVGAAGQTGRRVVTALKERGIPHRALVRNLESAEGVLPPDTEIVVGDVLQPETLKAALADCTRLICATGARPSLDPTGPLKVDYLGTRSLVKAAKEQGVEQFVLVSSLCVSRFFHPLNLFWLVLYWKQRAEAYLQESGLTYTIVRPGGLKNEDNDWPVVVEGPDRLFEGGIPRTKVARVCVEALFDPGARDKILEIVSRADAPNRPLGELFAQV
ncbi:MAG: NAD(P)H-binding protein [Cyanobacteria bacterium RI_101]|nr:NAD(P)H-binding protein [Cyanobacteria bacterium RI_101]